MFRKCFICGNLNLRKKIRMFNLSCFNTYKNRKQLYISKFELSYTTRSGKPKEKVKTKQLFNWSDLNSAPSPSPSKTTDLPTLTNWYFSSFWIQSKFEKYTETSKLLAQQQDHLILWTTWYWAILGPPRSVAKLITVSLQCFANYKLCLALLHYTALHIHIMDD